VSSQSRVPWVRAGAPWMVLAACDLLIGWMNVHATDDVQPVAAALLLAGFAFGAFRPRRWWLFALVLFVAVPVSGAYADAVNYHPGAVKPAPLYQSIIALVFPAAGALAGAGTRKLVGNSTEAGA
jgi:hypothetical protein